ncbi:MAG: hypothetical protein ISN28_01130 [Ectothiorhodospiraceae bacterium AqS1]|nr:hypothetical protein [Ectothiorhodospiraceae bacterium AqS1]
MLAGPSFAQTKPAHECVHLSAGTDLLIRNHTGDCEEAIKVSYRRTYNSECLSSSPTTINVGFSTTVGYSFPTSVCVEYDSSTHQTNVGYKSCGDLPTGCGSKTNELTVVVPDRLDPIAGTIQVTPAGTLSIDEGSSEVISVSLSKAPSYAAGVSITGVNSDVNLNPVSLTFLPSNYSTAQTVTVSAAQDTDESDESHTITLTASGGFSATALTKALTIVDDDKPPAGTILINPAGTLNLNEGDLSNFGLSISLSTKPDDDVTVSFSTTNSDVTFSPASLTFTESNYSTAQTVSVSANEDDDTSDESGTITVSASGGITAPDVTKAFAIADDDNPSGTIEVTPSGTISLSEGGASKTFSVSLSTTPKADVTITFSNLGDLILTPSSLTFTVANHAKVQTVSVSAGQDDDAIDDSDEITLTASGGFDAPAVMKSFTTTDDDEAEFTSSAASLIMTEGASTTFTVRLATQPSADVDLILNAAENRQKTNLLKIDVDSTAAGDQTRMTFNRSGQNNLWNQPRTVTITSVDDDDSDNETLEISGSGSGGDYEQKPVLVRVTVTDDDKPSGTIEVSPAGTLSIDEGASGTWQVSLGGTAPTSNVTVTLSKTNADVSLSPTTLTFTASNHSQAQPVTVSAAQDDDAANDTDTITLSATGGIDAPDITKSITIVDDDEAGFNLDPASLNMVEGGNGAFTVSMKARPSADVTVTLTSSKSGLVIDTDPDTTGDQTTLTFARSGQTNAWNRKAQVSVRSIHDDDADTDSFSISISGAGGAYQGKTASVAVAVADDDAPAGRILVTPAGTLSIDEGDSSAWQVSLSAAPTSSATVAFSLTNSDLTITPPSLTFTTSDFSNPQPVAIAAAEDDDRSNDSGTITIQASGGIDAPRLSRSFVIIDNDEPPPILPADSSYRGGVIVSPSLLTLEEGGREATLSIALDSAPASDVTVRLSKTNEDVSLVSDSVTFTPSSWGNKVDIAIFAGEDPDTTNDSDTIVLQIEDREVHSLALFIADDDSAYKEPIKTQALAIPPPPSKDDMNLRIRCRQEQPCNVLLECSTQIGGQVFQGRLPDPIPGFGALSLTSEDISHLIGWTLWSEGRLGCSLHSNENISSQVWTRSGDRVLVNNSAIIRSHLEIGGMHRADIESIPSPESFDEPNIRIRCNSESSHCTDLRFFCYTDDGSRYETIFEGLARGRTLHLQSQALARRLGIGWKGLGLTCEVRSDASFTAQVLARTGGGGALVNNSATGGR